MFFVQLVVDNSPTIKAFEYYYFSISFISLKAKNMHYLNYLRNLHFQLY